MHPKANPREIAQGASNAHGVAPQTGLACMYCRGGVEGARASGHWQFNLIAQQNRRRTLARSREMRDGSSRSGASCSAVERRLPAAMRLLRWGRPARASSDSILFSEMSRLCRLRSSCTPSQSLSMLRAAYTQRRLTAYSSPYSWRDRKVVVPQFDGVRIRRRKRNVLTSGAYASRCCLQFTVHGSNQHSRGRTKRHAHPQGRAGQRQSEKSFLSSEACACGHARHSAHCSRGKWPSSLCRAAESGVRASVNDSKQRPLSG